MFDIVFLVLQQITATDGHVYAKKQIYHLYIHYIEFIAIVCLRFEMACCLYLRWRRLPAAVCVPAMAPMHMTQL